jgi:hypothetical protein
MASAYYRVQNSETTGSEETPGSENNRITKYLNLKSSLHSMEVPAVSFSLGIPRVSIFLNGSLFTSYLH